MYAYIAEFIGVTLFLLVILFTGHPVLIGLSLTLIIYATRGFSGGHINPAVSVAMALLNKLNTQQLIGYGIFQILGALLAVFIYKTVKKIK